MIAKAWDWAKSKNLVRTNEIHGEEEIYIMTSETFDMQSKDTEESERSGCIQVQELFSMGLSLKHLETETFPGREWHASGFQPGGLRSFSGGHADCQQGHRLPAGKQFKWTVHGQHQWGHELQAA